MNVPTEAAPQGPPQTAPQTALQVAPQVARHGARLKQHHADPALIAVVALGGALGTAARYGANSVLGGRPVVTLAENLLGALLLGMLLEALVRAGPENGTRRLLRLGVGTGVLGGFTTYSTFAFEVQQLGADGQPWLALGYGLGSVLLGLAACLLGVLAAARWRGPSRLPLDPDTDSLVDLGAADRASGSRP